jgi:methylated-DNA-[protein]-cysteine S-methyltransferase
MTAIARFRSPLGPLAVEVTDEGLCGIAPAAGRRTRPSVTHASRAHLEAAVAALAAYFRGEAPALPPLDLRGSAFDRVVWHGLLEIPFGETRTYGELAAGLGMPGAARAVGAANGRNPIWILVPCHRVVAAGGGLGGYAGGLDAKRWLLAHEAEHGPVLRAPRLQARGLPLRSPRA